MVLWLGCPLPAREARGSNPGRVVLVISAFVILVLDVSPPINNDSYPILREEVEATVKSLKKGRSGQHSNGAGPGRRKGHDRYVTHHLQ